MLEKHLKKIYRFLRSKKRLIIISLIALFLFLTYSQYIKSVIVMLLFIVLGSVSKLYHKFFKSTLGVDLVLFLSLMISIVYKNPMMGLIVAWPSLILADYLAAKLSHTSIITLLSLTLVVLISKFFLGLPLIFSLILLTIIFEIIASVFYALMGSSVPKIITFIISHFIFNLIIILSLAINLFKIMN